MRGTPQPRLPDATMVAMPRRALSFGAVGTWGRPQVLPDAVDVAADITVPLARRC